MDYYIDIDRFFSLITAENLRPPQEVTTETLRDSEGEDELVQTVTKTLYPSTEVNAPKYELLSSMLEVVLNQAPEDQDSTLGVNHMLEQSDFTFRLAFNTLEHYEILKER